MGKLAIAGATVLAGGGISAGGVILSKLFSFDSTLPEKLDDFENNPKNYGCIKDKNMFSDLNVSESSSGSSSIDDKFLDSSKDSEGCLVVNWNKKVKEGDNTKWSGNFRLLWVVGQKNKGFIVFATATSSNTSSKQLDWQGVAYAVEKGSTSPNAWKVSKSKKIGSGKKIDQSSLESKFPQVSSSFYSGASYRGFVDKKEDLSNLCEDNTCTNDKSSFKGYWEWKGKPGEAQELGGWTSKLKDWWTEFYDTSGWDMESVVKDMKGTWSQKVPQKN